MTAACFRCDWVGDADDRACPRCDAPLYRPAPRPPARRDAARPDGRHVAVAPEAPDPALAAAERPPSEARAAATSPRSVFALVGMTFFVILVLVSGGPEDEPSRVTTPPSAHDEPTGILVYAVPDGRGSARLWRWDLASGDVRRGPLIPEPAELVNVRSPSYGWLGITADAGGGELEASILDSFEVGAEVEPLGRGEIVTWAREGQTVLLVQRGPVSGGCRRRVRAEAVHVDRRGRERVFDGSICGDIVSMGRTSVGHFLTRSGPGGVDVVGAGYTDAGVLLRDHGLIAISPGGDMLVTPEADLLTEELPPVPSRAVDGPPPPVAGRLWLYSQFTGAPSPIVVDDRPLRVHRVLAYDPGAATALVLARTGDEAPGLWEVPLRTDGGADGTPRLVGSAGGITAAAYTNDGSAYVVTNGWLHRLEDHVLRQIEPPEGAPRPAGPLAWVVQEPITDL